MAAEPRRSPRDGAGAGGSSPAPGVGDRVRALLGRLRRRAGWRDLAARLEVERRRLVASNELTAALSGARTRADVARTMIEKGLAVFGADAGVLALVGPDGRLELVDQPGYPEDLVATWPRPPAAPRSPLSDAVRLRAIAWVGSAAEALARYPEWATAVQALAGGRHRAWAALPLVAGDRVLGGLGLAWRAEWPFSPEDEHAFVSVAARCAQALDRARALEEARDRAAELEAVLEAAPIPIFITRDAEATRIDANRAAEELLGIGPRANASLAAPPAERARFVPMRDGVPIPLDELPMQAAARFGRETRDLEYDIVRGDGAVRRVVANARPIVDPEGNRRGAVGAFVDVTRRKEVEDRLRDADARKSEFLAVLSHELRNPLAPISNALVLLDRAPPGSSAALHAREVLHRQTRHLTRLVDDLLDLTRVTHGKIDLQLARVDAREIARRACADVRALFEERRVQLRWSAGPEPVWVDADVARLAQVVGNLLSNALKFTSPGGHVTVEVGARDGACEIAVRDDGIGLEGADLERIFEPFVQAGRAGHGGHGGLGIGLALVRELARRHGGSVRATSDGPRRGATFAVSLPRAPGPPAAARVQAAETQASGLSILVVEDNEDAATTLADILALGGHQVRVVGTGRAGVEAALAVPPDVLVCDIGLPDMSGHDVVRALRAAASAGPPYAIALTGYAQPQDREAALAAGFDAHLAKPPPLDELNALLAAAAHRTA
ncbi:MAG TPA: ATP-binding protein [Anaeromyxobacter sp.]|nr:ATP-binding protein [Anaeromyxobacter sp.]